MTERSWRESLPDVRLLALWLLEHGDRKVGGQTGPRFGSEVQGTNLLLEFMSCEYGNPSIQLSVAPANSSWKAALGLAVPDHFDIKPRRMVDARDGKPFDFDGQIIMPDYFGGVDMLDKIRQRRKTSPGSDQMNPMYVAYWFLRYGEIAGSDKFSDPTNPESIFGKSPATRPYSYLNDPQGKFASDFIAAKLLWS